MNTIFYTFWCKNDYDISINSYSLLNIDTYGSIEIHFAEKRALKIVI